MNLLPDPIRKRYLAKFALVVLIVLIATATAGLYFQGQVSAELTHEVHNEMETVAELEAQSMSQWVEEHEQNARMLSEFGALKDGNPAAITTQIDHELAEFPESAQAIHYLDLESEIIELSTSGAIEGRSLDSLDLRWTDGSLDFESASEVAVSEGYEVDGQALVAFVSPVEGTSKAVMISVNTSTRAAQFRDPIEGGYTQVVDSQGTIEFAGDPAQVLTTYRNGEGSAVLDKASRGAGVAERDETGEVVGYAPVEGTDWVVLTHAPQENAYVLRSTVAQDFILLVGIALLGFVFVGATIGRNTVRTLNSLTDKARAIAEGRVETDIEETDRIDELGRVQNAFARTQSYLQTVSEQSKALARQDFDDPVLQEDVPGSLGESLQAMQADMDEFIVELERAKAEAQESRAQAEEMAEGLEQQAQQFGDVMQEAADGDLTQRLETDLDHESMAEIASGFNEMLDQLETTVGRIQQFATDVAAASDEVATGAEEVENASEQVARSIEEISHSATRQDDNFQQIADEMTDLSATVQEIASSSDEVADVSEQAADRGETGSALASESVTQLDEIEAKTAETVTEIEQLDAEMDRIGEIITLIEEIAEQTNMLALNASIEAARAGEAGEGFGVVADEIKGLAEETHDATQEIEELITEVQTSTGEAATDMREMRDLVGDGMETIDESLTALEDIVAYVEDANTGVQSINDATDEQADSTQEVVSMVDDVATLSEQTNEEATNVSAAAEEQTASVAQIAENAQSLTDQAAELQGMVEAFEVGNGSTALEGSPEESATADMDTGPMAADGGDIDT